MTMAIAVTACGNSKDNEDSTTKKNDATGENESDAGAEDITMLKAGVWLANDAENYSYYIFNDDGETGSVIDQATGTGIAFSYEADDDKVTFKMGAEDAEAPAVVEQTDEDNVTLKWDEGTEEKLSYISNDNADTFKFYTNDELCEMALAYYKTKTTEDTTGMMAAAETSEDGKVLIQIFSNNGGHNSTADWYTVDRITAEGTNIAEENIDLK